MLKEDVHSRVCIPLLAIFLGSCAGATIEVRTDPDDALVEIYRPGHAPQSLGRTPLKIEQSKYEGLFDEQFRLTVKKDGYKRFDVLIPKSASSADTQLYVDLKSEQLPAACVEQRAAVNEVAQGAASAQDLIKKKSFNEAEMLLRSLLVKFPDISVFHDLMGNLLYLKRDLAGALNSYKKSHALNKTNPETERMIKKIAAIRGSGGEDGQREPASERGFE